MVLSFLIRENPSPSFWNLIWFWCDLVCGSVKQWVVYVGLKNEYNFCFRCGKIPFFSPLAFEWSLNALYSALVRYKWEEKERFTMARKFRYMILASDDILPEVTCTFKQLKYLRIFQELQHLFRKPSWCQINLRL